MTENDLNFESIIKRILRDMGYDKKRTALLGLVALFALVLIGKSVISKFTPARAQASQDLALKAKLPETSIQNFRWKVPQDKSSRGALPRTDRKITRDIFEVLRLQVVGQYLK